MQFDCFSGLFGLKLVIIGHEDGDYYAKAI